MYGRHHPKFILLYIHVFWMAFCDMGFSLTFLALYLPMLTHDEETNYWDHEDDIICSMLSIVSQFFQSGAFCWYAMICTVLFNVLNGSDYEDILTSINAQKVIVWTVCFTTTGLTLVASAADWWKVEHFNDDLYVSCWSRDTR
eukprot:UN27222